MAQQRVEQSSARREKLLPLLILLVLAAFAVRSVLVQLPAHAASLPETRAIQQAQVAESGGEASSDDGPGMDEAAVAKLPER